MDGGCRYLGKGEGVVCFRDRGRFCARMRMEVACCLRHGGFFSSGASSQPRVPPSLQQFADISGERALFSEKGGREIWERIRHLWLFAMMVDSQILNLFVPLPHSFCSPTLGLRSPFSSFHFQHHDYLRIACGLGPLCRCSKKLVGTRRISSRLCDCL